MRKTLTALAAAATIAVAAVATSTDADARRGWGWRGPAFFGGLAAGAFIAGTLARPYDDAPRPYYYYETGPVYYYAPGPVQYEVYPAPGYGCWAFSRGYRYYVC
jgi:hypothetical protein